ncbi:MAG: ANTAR domain-containing protein, partial [Janthinobacterium lividum]
TGEAILNVDLRTSHQRWPDFTRAALAAGVRSTSALPMRLRGRVIGALNLFSDRHDVMSTATLTLGQAMADVATIGLLNERSLREKTLLSEQLQGALQSRILIEQAKGVIAARAGISVQDGFHRLRQHARRTGTALTLVATAVIEGELQL